MKFASSVFFALSTLSTANSNRVRTGQHAVEKGTVTGRIVNGNPASRREYPYYVDLHGCGGTLIAPNVVLTAAHCDDNYAGKTVYIGSIESQSVGQHGSEVVVEKQLPHPQYAGRPTERNDIKLLKLRGEVCMDGFTLDIATPSSYGALSPGQSLVAVGLGDTTDGGESSDVLLEVTLPFVSHGECEEAFETDPATQMCAGDSTGRDTCQGDSGGPLVVYHSTSHHTLVGATSFGGACGSAFGVYTAVGGYHDWIKSTVCDTWGLKADFCPNNPVRSCTPSTTTSTSSTSTSNSECEDYPNWIDADNYTCADHEAEDCIYFGWDIDGVAVEEACCACKP